MSHDTIPPRPDEQLDEVRLAAFLADKGALLEVATPTEFTVRQFGGGMANLTYLLAFADGQERVLRRPPLGPVAASAHDMGREYNVLSRLWRTFPLAPRAYLLGDDAAVIGAPFFVMERRQGVVVRGRLPAEWDNPHAPAAISTALVEALADLHCVDYAALGLADLGKPEGFVGRQIEGWFKRWQAAKHTEIPAMEQIYEWLRDNQPPNQGSTLVHNDYKLDNVMLDEENPGRLVAIFDWDMCTLGDPLCDLGALLTYWTDPDDPPYLQAFAASFMPTGKPFLTRAELVARYAARTGFDVSQIHFYHALGLYRLAVILAQIYIRYVRGQTKDARFAPLGEMVPLLAQAAVAKSTQHSALST
jgi:aminoglycoside phosphotransferase (APT) family kinase protein